MVDLIIIAFVILGAFVGAKRGFTRELVSVIGFIVCIILAFLLKNPIASFLYDHLPFFSFGGILKGVTALNILLYEVIAFLITLSLLGIALNLVKVLTNLFEKFLSATIILGFCVGVKRGLTSELVSVVGFIVCIVLAFLLKNPIAAFLYDHLPFFSFGGIIKGVTALNIILYEVIAFLITLSLLGIVLNILKIATNIFEKFLNATIILGIPSKILGGILGALEWIVISYIVLFILALPVFNTKVASESILYKSLTPIASKFSKDINNTIEVFNEFKNLKDEYSNSNDTNQFNLDSLDLLLKYHIIDVESATKL